MTPPLARLATKSGEGIGPAGTVLYDTHEYSMPPDSLCIQGRLYLYRERVRSAAGRHEAVHSVCMVVLTRRGWRRPRASGPALHATQRERLLGLGREALEYLTKLTPRRPRVWVRDVDRLHELPQRHGDEALRVAFERGLTEHAIGAEYAAHYLSSAPKAAPDSIQRELPL